MKRDEKKSTGALNLQEVTSTGMGRGLPQGREVQQQWTVSSVLAFLRSEAAIRDQSTDPYVWKTGSFLPTWLLQTALKLLWEYLHSFLPWGLGERWVSIAALRTEIGQI